MSLLTLNAGSSSLKFSVYDRTASEERLRGHVDGVGPDMRLSVSMAGRPSQERALPGGARSHADALASALEVIAEAAGETVHAIGHRVVHGGPDYAEPILLDAEIEAHLRDYIPLAPLHQPHNLAGVDAARAAFPDAPQVACFDTAFHRTHPWVNDTFALPRKYFDRGVRRYGFHGLSYEYLAQRLAQLDPEAAKGRAIIAHLGNGASMCALRGGVSVGASMGFSALDGLPMGTRCGQLDPGVILHMLDHDGLDSRQITELLYKQSGLLALSQISSDMRTLQQSADPKAAEAIEYFVFRCRRELAAMTAILEGLDAVVFSGGIGENSAYVRERIGSGFGYLGFGVDAERNAAANGDASLISPQGAAVRAWAIRTDEECMIARHTAELVGLANP
ncbi:MAG: acetate/propionate family kinase [Pseudomonadota bacterium]